MQALHLAQLLNALREPFVIVFLRCLSQVSVVCRRFPAGASRQARFPVTAPLAAPATPAYTANMRHPIDPKVDCVFKVREQQRIQLAFDDLRAEVEQARADAEQARAANERGRAAKKQARADAEQERAAKDQALAENERLTRLLADKPEPSDPGTR